MRKVYKLGKDARETLKHVATQVGDILGKTLGPAGRNYSLPVGITNDGRTILAYMDYDDECEADALLAFHEVARQQDNDAGDGTTTASVITSQLVLDVVDKVGDIDVPVFGDKSVMQLARELDEEKDKAIAILETKKRPVESLEDLEKIAFTAMENKEGSKLIASALYEGGKDCYPVIKDGYNGKLEKDVINGVEFPLHIATTSMFNKPGVAELSNVPVIVVNHAFESYQEITPLMQSIMALEKKPTGLVIVAKQFSIPFVQTVAEVVNKARFPMVLLSSPIIHEDTFQDIAAYVDAKLVDTHPRTGKKITSVTINDAGFVKSILAREKVVQFIGGRGMDVSVPVTDKIMSRVQHRVEEIKKIQEKEEGKDRELSDKRIAALLGGITTIYVDAKTSAEKYYLKLKVEDAMNSCRAALNGGMVKGGGLTYMEVADELGEESHLYNALRKCNQRIIQNNMGAEIDMTGVEDAFIVAKSAIENAVSVVKTVITIEGFIADKNEDLVDALSEKLNS